VQLVYIQPGETNKVMFVCGTSCQSLGAGFIGWTSRHNVLVWDTVSVALRDFEVFV